MANVKITQLPLATTPLTGTEVFPLVQGTTTKQVAITGLFTSPVMTNPTLGTVGQADLINATGLPISTGVAGLGTGIATFLGTPSSSNLRAAVTDETGTGSLVFATSPVLVTPNLGTPSVLVATNATGTAVGLTAGSAITNANLTGAVTSVGNATSLGSFTSAQLRTALTDETGAGSAVFATSPTITAPILNQINDTNNAQILGLSPTTSAVDYLVVKNGIGVGVPLHFYADGSSANIGLHIQPKGSGLITISDGTDFNKGIRFRSSGSAASAVTLLDAVSTAGRVVTLPDATTTLVGRDTTDTLTNKTIAFGSNTFSGSLAIANGGTGQATANAAFNALAPSQTGNSGKYLTTDGTDTSWASNPLGTVTSVAATVPSFLSISGSPITTSGTLAISLSGTALPTTSGGTNLTSFTSGGVVYASSSSALATGSALTFDGTSLDLGTVGAKVNFATTGSATRNYVGGSADGYSLEMVTQRGAIQPLSYKQDFGAGHVWSVASSTALTLNSTSLYTASGINVGFGTSSTSGARLNVVSTGANSRIAIGDTAADTYSTLLMYGGSGKYNFQLGVQNNVNNAFEITPSTAVNGTTFSTPAFVLNSSGNLGLGVTNPYTTLSVSGNITLQKNASNVIQSYTGSAYTNLSYDAALHTWFTSGSERARIDSSGNLLVGTTTTKDVLTVSNGISMVGGGAGSAASYSGTDTRTWASSYVASSGTQTLCRIDNPQGPYSGGGLVRVTTSYQYRAGNPGNNYAQYIVTTNTTATANLIYSAGTYPTITVTTVGSGATATLDVIVNYSGDSHVQVVVEVFGKVVSWSI